MKIVELAVQYRKHCLRTNKIAKTTTPLYLNQLGRKHSGRTKQWARQQNQLNRPGSAHPQGTTDKNIGRNNNDTRRDETAPRERFKWPLTTHWRPPITAQPAPHFCVLLPRYLQKCAQTNSECVLRDKNVGRVRWHSTSAVSKIVIIIISRRGSHSSAADLFTCRENKQM